MRQALGGIGGVDSAIADRAAYWGFGSNRAGSNGGYGSPINHSAYSIAIHLTLSELDSLEVGSSGLVKGDGLTNPRHFSLKSHQTASRDDETSLKR